MKVYRYLIFIFLAFSIIYSNSNISGFSNFYYISKLDDGGIIKAPYRMIGFNWEHSTKDLRLRSSIALEYQPRNDSHFLQNDPQDFLFDLRELYFTWYPTETFQTFVPLEVSIGKQFSTWGFTDQNSPLDVVNPIDYNYLFETGTQRKLASIMGKVNIDLNNLSIELVSSPFHGINRFPSSVGEVLVELPVIPVEHQLWDDEFMGEYGANISLMGDGFDVSASYFNGKGRIFNLSGINVHEYQNSAWLYPDTVFSYRSTEMVGLGYQITQDNLVLSFDGGYFTTKDNKTNIERIYPNPDYAHLDITEIYEDRSYNFTERAEYYQFVFQLETSIFYDIDFLGQIFIYDGLKYEAIDLPFDYEINIPGFVFNADEFDSGEYFYPDMGSSLGFLTNRAILFSLKKLFNSNRILVNYKNISDLEYSGSFNELELSYKINDNTKIIMAINSITGDENHPRSQSSIESENEDYVRAEDYPFNQMKDYSHIRLQIKFNF